MNRTMMALGLAAAIALPTAAAAAETQPPPRIIVTGEGEAAVPPDMALLSLSVMREAKTAREALDANNAAMAEVIAAIKLFGIADRDLQTAGIQINPRYNYTNKPDGTQEAELVAYQVTNTLSVRIRDLVKTGEILDKAVSLGVNQGGNIVFANDDPSAVITEARKKAVANAMAKARTLSRGGRRAARPRDGISDQSFPAQPMPIEAKAFDRAAQRRAGRGRRKRLQGAGQHDLRAEIASGLDPWRSRLQSMTEKPRRTILRGFCRAPPFRKTGRRLLLLCRRQAYQRTIGQFGARPKVTLTRSPYLRPATSIVRRPTSTMRARRRPSRSALSSARFGVQNRW